MKVQSPLFKVVVLGLLFVILFTVILFNKGINEPIDRIGVGEEQKQDTVGLSFHSVLFKNKQDVTIYVSPTGNDEAIGNKEHPVMSPEKARDIVRLIKNNHKYYNKKYTVVFLEGEYLINQTFELTDKDKGTIDNSVVYKGEEGKYVVFTGGKSFTKESVVSAKKGLGHWNRLDSAARKHIKMVNLKELGIFDFGKIKLNGYHKSKQTPLELFIDDKAMILARWPNQGYLDIDSVIDSVTFIYNSKRFKRWEFEQNAWAKGFWNVGWADHDLPIKSVDVKKNKIKLNAFPERGFRLAQGQKWYQWYAFNVLSELDTLGEYYIDRESGWLYFMYNSTEDLVDVKMSVSMFGLNNEPVIKMDSTSNIIIQNITISDTRASGIDMDNVSRIKIENCIIKNLGTYAISLQGLNCSLSNISVFNTGSYGIEITGGDRKRLIKANNLVENCTIHDLGRINYTYTAFGVSLDGVGNIVRNCEIYNSPHTAIFFKGNYHTIEKNKIHDVCVESDDAGAIYAGRDWGSRGNTIQNNFIYHIRGSQYKKRRKGIHAIYLDDCASGISITGNVLFKVNKAGVLNGGGRDNIISNNLFVECKYAHKADRRAQLEWNNESMYLQLDDFDYKNSPWSDSFPQLAEMSEWRTNVYEALEFEKIGLVLKKYSLYDKGIPYNSDWDPNGCVFKNNIVWKNGSDEYLMDTRTSKAKKHGPFKFYTIESNLIEQDPLFEDIGKLNLNLLDNSPAYSILGFQRIPFEKIGVMSY